MRRTAALALVLAVVFGGSGCDLHVPFHRGKRRAAGGKDVSVFAVKAGSCVTPPTKIKAQIEKIHIVDCKVEHTAEIYAVVKYTADQESASDTYPGDKALHVFADGACLERFEPYTGQDYSDSKLFFTYLLPSAKGWTEQRDRNVICFLTTTGELLTRSMRDTTPGP